MKKLVIALSLIISATAAYAQRPEAGAKGFTFGIGGLGSFGLQGVSNQSAANPAPNANSSLLFRYYLSSDLALRVGANYTKTGTTSNTPPNGSTNTTTKDKTTNSNLGLALGIQKSLGSGEKLEPYVGLDLLVGHASGKEDKRTDFAAGNNQARSAGDFDETVTQSAPAMRLGLAPVVGFNYFFVKNFAVGAEFAYKVTTTSTAKYTTVQTSQNGAVATSTTTTTPKSSAGGFSAGGGASGVITVSVFF
jgi:hypothetical protein